MYSFLSTMLGGKQYMCEKTFVCGHMIKNDVSKHLAMWQGASQCTTIWPTFDETQKSNTTIHYKLFILAKQFPK